MSGQPDPVVAAFLRGDADEFVAECAPDVLLDANVPTWRFQLKGREGVRQLLAEEEFLAGRTVTTWRSVPVADGLLLDQYIDTMQQRHRSLSDDDLELVSHLRELRGPTSRR